MGKSSEPQVQYSQSPEQQAVYQAVMPIIQRLSGANAQGMVPTTTYGMSKPQQSDFTTQGGFNPNINYRQAGGIDYSLGMPSGYSPGGERYDSDAYDKAMGRYNASAETSYEPLYNIPSYQIPSPYSLPDASMLTPTAQWYDNLSPEVMAGIRAPFIDASRQLTESMGGTAGSASAGASGAMGAAQGRFWADAGKNMGLQAWNMTYPGEAMAYGAELDRSRTAYGTELSRNQSLFNTMLQRNMLPYSILPGMMGGTYSNPVVGGGGGGIGGAAIGALGGGMAADMMGLSMSANPVMFPAAIALGALGGSK